MDFIERLFGIAPDGGSGSFELLLFAVPLLVAGFLLVRRVRPRRSGRRQRRDRR